MKKAKHNLTVLVWALKVAFHISPLVFSFWILFSGLLAILPAGIYDGLHSEGRYENAAG